MAVSTGYDYGIRSGLVGKGVNPSSISYDAGRGYVTVGGKDFMKADKVYNGSSFTTQQNFDNAWNAYNNAATTSIGTPPTTGYTPPTTQPSPTSAVPAPAAPSNMDAYNQHMATIDALMKQTVDPNAVYASPEWAAYQAQAAKQAQANTRAAQEAYGSAGFGRSYALGERAQGIQNDATQYMNTQVLPQLMAQARAEQQQKIQNEYGLLDRTWNQVTRDDQLAQNATQNAISKGQLLGVYTTPEMEAAYNEVLQAKQDYALAKTPEERAAAHSRAEAARAKLTGMNANAGLVGSDVTYDQSVANKPNYGIKTAAQQQAEWERSHTEAMDKVAAEQTAYNRDPNNPAVQAQILANKIDQLKLDNLPQHLKLELEQLQQQVKSGSIDLKTAEHNLKELTDPNSVTNKTKQLQLEMTQIDAKNYSQEAKLKLEQLQKTVDQIGKEPALTDNEKAMQDIAIEKARIELQNLKNGTPDKQLVATDFIKIINDLPYLQDEVIDGEKTGRKIVNNPDGLKSYILSLGLSDAETTKLYTAYGLPLPNAGK